MSVTRALHLIEPFSSLDATLSYSCYLPRYLRRRLDNEFMLVGMYPLLELLKLLAFPELNLLRQDGRAPVHSKYDIMHHYASPPCLASFEITERTLYRSRAVVFT